MTTRIHSRFISGTPAVFAFVLSIWAFALLPACAPETQPPQRPAHPVSVGTVVQKDVPVLIQAIGNVEAYNTVSVKSQVGGELIRVHFAKGNDVKKNELLFTIDPRPYKAALEQAEANLAKDTAQLENARLEVQRYKEMADQGIISKEMQDRVQTNAAALEAAVRADKAVVENARLQLKYCYIYSPIAGRTGDLLTDEGNVIKANADTAMVVINQIQPVYVSFSVPEMHLADVEQYMKAGTIRVGAFVANDETPVEGELTFVNNQVDRNTGTIELKATFPNEQKRLWPGQFVTVSMTLTTQPGATVVPSQAVNTGQQGEYVFVVKDDLTVEHRPVTIAETIGDEAVVLEGLQPGERVVTDGQLRLVSGAKVEIKNSAEGGAVDESGTP